MRDLTFYIVLLFYTGSFGQSVISNPLKPPLADFPVARPAEIGMNEDTIQRYLELIQSTPPADLRGLVVIKDGKLVVEEYFNTYWRETIHDIRSAGKSITALLLGIAIDQGLISDVDQKVCSFFPEFGSYPACSDKGLTIRHLLTMSSGLNADSGNSDSPGNSGNWIAEDNWVELAMSLDYVFTPGSQWVYTDVCPMLLGAIIERTSGMLLRDFAARYLFAPLSIREYYWYTGKGGQTGPMGNLYISALDFAKIGYLILNDGMFSGKEIVSAKWIHEMTLPRMDISSLNPFSDDYGYFWYLNTTSQNGRTYRYFFASGNGGNVLFIVPDQNMVVSIISSAYGQGYGHQRSHNVFQGILRAIK